MLFLNSVAPLQTPTHLLKWCCNSLGIRRKETWLPRSERFLKVTLLLELQLQDRPLIFGETIPTSRVQAPIQEAHLVAVDASDHSTSDPEPFLDAVLIAEEFVILLGIAGWSLKLLKSNVSFQCIAVSVPFIVCLRYISLFSCNGSLCHIKVCFVNYFVFVSLLFANRWYAFKGVFLYP